MNDNQKTLTIIGVILICALAVTAVYGIFHDNVLNTNDNNDLNDEFTITFEEYKDPVNPTTTVKYYIDGKDVTGKTMTFTKEVPATVVVSSETQMISSIKLDYIPEFGEVSISNTHGDDLVGSDMFDMDITIRHIFDKANIVATLNYFFAIGESTYTTSTTFSIENGLVCTVGGQNVTDGETIILSHDARVYIKSSKVGHIWYSANWSTGMYDSEDEYPVSEMRCDIYVSFYDNATGNATVKYTSH